MATSPSSNFCSNEPRYKPVDEGGEHQIKRSPSMKAAIVRRDSRSKSIEIQNIEHTKKSGISQATDRWTSGS